MLTTANLYALTEIEETDCCIGVSNDTHLHAMQGYDICAVLERHSTRMIIRRGLWRSEMAWPFAQRAEMALGRSRDAIATG